MTGWGQDGPLAQAAGHDMNYIAITGALHMMGQTQSRPQFPANLVGDFGGGSTYLVIGILAALLEARISGQGQVVDAAIVDGTAHLNAMTAAFLASGGYQGGARRQPARRRRARSTTSTRPPTASTCRSARSSRSSSTRWSTLLGRQGHRPGQGDLDRYDEMRAVFTETFKQRTQAEWVELFEGTDACVAGIIPISEASEHPHLKARGDLRRARRDGAARAGAPVLAHRGRPSACRRRRPPASTPARRSPPGASPTSTG